MAAFIAAIIIKNKILNSFLAGFLGIALLWSIMTFILSAGNDFILLSWIAGIFNLTTFPMVLVISISGGFLGGFAAATASQLKNIFRKERPEWQPRYR